ncbi:choline/carnitine O-acyltransferase [Kocuria sp. JC486]|uniref:choline/carnitine O-acyltransferase n=1 Tax=Kocuria sp. JC486 TaxID=1970736 RepID=UPI00142414A8|nr:choline/carnitine O-acyltransferase [Kocuria sp. JC486]NHU84208.1 choline/carnitine O-acyltransferase [Kocuria sp. JC486]
MAKTLPVPALGDTLERFANATEPLTGAEDRDRTVGSVTDFSENAAPGLQEELTTFADAESGHGRSYLSAAWLDTYLDTREPLPLTTSVSFQLSGFDGNTGVPRCADFIHRAATIHLQEVRGETPVEVDPRGTTLDMDQWQILAGGIRHPLPNRDEIRCPAVSASGATIGMLVGGRLFSMPIAGGDGLPLPVDAIEDLLEQVIAGDRSKQPASDGQEQVNFTDLSYLGSETAAPLLAELLTDPHNAETYGDLTEMIFVVHLLTQAHDDGDGSAPQDTERLRNLAFQAGHAWTYKPITYELSLTTDWQAIHFEHSAADGATVRAAVARMQELELLDPASSTSHEPREPAPEPRELTWITTPEFRGRVAGNLEEYARQSAQYRVTSVFAPRADMDGLDLRVSDDAVAQLLMTYAQVATYGSVRSVYESVDMREFQAGRTECLRPLTPQAVEFARALIAGDATLEQFGAVLDAHRDWVKACKRGAGIDRHLFGLRMMAERAGTGLEFFDNLGLQALSSDFLSTTSLGESQPINRYAFAPSLAHGLGIGYIKYDDGFEYVINYRADHAERVEEFAQNLVAAGEALGTWVESLG